MNKLDLTTIILTYNEEIHIRRCLENVCPFSRKVIVVDSPSTDRTVEICKEFENVEVVVHKYPGNQAEQFNWVVDNIEISTEWVLRIDADEYLLPELVEEMEAKLPILPMDVTGIELKRRHIFMDKWVKRGVYPVLIMRMFRKGMGRYDDARLMDEHIALKEGYSIALENDFCDHSLIDLSDYCHKHINYAQREAYEVLNDEFNLSGANDRDKNGGLAKEAEEKHKRKSDYNKLPLFWRSFAYFCYRYIVRGGFLDGKEGFLFAFIQGWWYRAMVDGNILACKKVCGKDKEKIKMFIKDRWNISL